MIVDTRLGLKYVTIADRGNITNERVQLEAVNDCSSSAYIILASLVSAPGNVFAGGRPAFWFPYQEIKAGDNVIVYTKAGAYVKLPRPDGHSNHFFYWGMMNALFGASNACVVVAELNAWEAGL